MHRRARVTLAFVLLLFGTAGCRRLEEQLDHHQQKFESLGSTAMSIGDAWLAGSVSSRYARTALDRTLELVEQERTALGQRPDALVDSRGARMSESAERLSRTIARLAADVDRADQPSTRAALASMPFVAPDQK